MQFKDRKDAGQALAKKLPQRLKHQGVQVLALPRGGVPVAAEVARALNVPMDVLTVRKLGMPGREEVAIGAIARGGVQVLFDDIVAVLHISDVQLQALIARQQEELARRERVYRGDRPFPNVKHRTVILVDDGLATGATLEAAALALRKYQPESIVGAVPVAPYAINPSLMAVLDELVVVHQAADFFGVGQFYQNFDQTTDAEVQNLLSSYASVPPAPQQNELGKNAGVRNHK